MSIVALKQGQIEVVQASMLGSILSNLLLVMGMCFFLGGLYNMRDADGHGVEQSFASATAQTSCSMMALSSATLIIPAAVSFFLPFPDIEHGNGVTTAVLLTCSRSQKLYGVLDNANGTGKEDPVLWLSRGTAIILLILYVTYLYFQLHTHSNLFDPAEPAPADPEANILHPIISINGTHDRGDSSSSSSSSSDEPEEHLSTLSAAAVLVAVTVVIAVCAEYLVDSIDAIVASGALSKSFIGLILLPIVGNAAEHVTACVVAVRNKMDLAMSVAIGSSIQIALLVTPFLVVLGWAVLDQPMTLHFGRL